MTKIDVWARRPKVKRHPETRSFQDIDIDGEPHGDPFELTLESIYDNSARALQEQANYSLLAEAYLPDPETGLCQSVFPAVSGELIPISEPLLRIACTLEAMQPEEMKDRYDVTEMIALLSPLHIRVQTAMMNFASEVNSNNKKK